MDVSPDRTDESLALALRHDSAPLGELIDRYEARLSRYIGRSSHASAQDIQDILQNTFLKIYRNINDFDPSLPFSSWAYRIARNEMIDWYRKDRRTPHLSLEASDALLARIVSTEDIAAAAMEGQSRERVRAAVRSLAPAYRELAELRYFEEKSYDEIADILMMPIGTVSVRLHRIKKLLRAALISHE